MMPNGLRYRRLGGTRQRQFDGTNFKLHKVLENAQSPRRRVHPGMMELSFATKERLAVWTKDVRKLPIFREKDAFWAIPGCRSENSVIIGFAIILYQRNLRAVYSEVAEWREPVQSSGG